MEPRRVYPALPAGVVFKDLAAGLPVVDGLFALFVDVRRHTKVWNIKKGKGSESCKSTFFFQCWSKMIMFFQWNSAPLGKVLPPPCESQSSFVKSAREDHFPHNYSNIIKLSLSRVLYTLELAIPVVCIYCMYVVACISKFGRKF
jgi:hypothetical protein